MPYNFHAPDVYISEEPAGARPIEAVGTSTAGFIGKAPKSDRALLKKAVAVNNWTEFLNKFAPEGSQSTPLALAVYGFFENGGSRCYVVDIADGAVDDGLKALETVDEIAILAAPGFTDAASYSAILSHCELLHDRVAILDSPEVVEDINDLLNVAVEKPGAGDEKSGKRPRNSDDGFGSFYYPWITVRDPLNPTQRVNAAPSGHIAGIWARSDAARGVHKAPANELVRGALSLTHALSRDEIGLLNDAGVNSLRFFSREGIRVWGGRTLAASSSEWRYLNVRRLFNMIEESIVNSTRWIVFEPNDYTLWKSIRRDISAFLTLLWRDGALMGRTPQEAFFVKCDEETNPPESIDRGYVVTIIGIAPVKPAEFIVFRIRQHQRGPEIE
jgi:phage tail sheath protein FI